MKAEPVDVKLKESFLADDHVAVARLLAEQPDLRQHLGPREAGCIPPLAAARSREMVDVLIECGARVEDVSQWWAPGFGVEQVRPDIAQYLVERGAGVSIHAAVGIGLVEVVREMLRRDPQLVRAKGGDGCTPLHFCRNLEIAGLLIDHGAGVDARDEDHGSTPVQWRIGDASEVVKYLLQQGAAADIFLAVGLGDVSLVQELVAEHPACTTFRIGNNSGPFPGIGFEGRGGTIYQWSLGFNMSPHEVALERGHDAIYEFLLQNTPPMAKFLVACTSANRPLAESIALQHPGIVNELDDEARGLLAKFCWETNKNIEAVRLMLDLGFPVDAPERNHGYTPLHNSAWCGDPELVRLLLDRGHPTDVRDPQYGSTAVGWAIYSCLEARRHPEGQFPEVAELLLAHGAPFEPQRFPVGDAAIDAVIKQHLDSQAACGGDPERSG